MSEPSASSSATAVRSGALAWTGKRLPLQVLRSAAGHYIGKQDDEGPVSRESVEYFPNHLAAQRALDENASVSPRLNHGASRARIDASSSRAQAPRRTAPATAAGRI